MSFLDAITGAASDLYHGACDVGNAVGGAVTSAENGIMGGVHKAEDFVNTETHALASDVAGVPVLGAVASAAADAVSTDAEFLGGVVGGATSLVGGVVNAVAHPLDTAAGLEALAEHMPGPLGTMLTAGHQAVNVAEGKESVGDALNNTLNPLAVAQNDAQFFGQLGSAIIDPYKKEADEGRYGEMAGRAAFDIGSLLLGAGEVEAGADAARAGELAADTARVADGADAARVADGADAARAVDPLGPTIPAPADPMAPTMPAPADPMAPTMPAPGEVSQLPPGVPNPYDAPIPKAPKLPTDFGPIQDNPIFGHEPEVGPATTAPTLPAPADPMAPNPYSPDMSRPTIPAADPLASPTAPTLPPAASPANGSLGTPFDPDHIPAPGEKINWPGNGGADAAGWNNANLPPGAELDRFGGEGGRYLAPAGTPMEGRAMAPVYNDEMAEAMGMPKGSPVPPAEYNVYSVPDGEGLPVQQSAAAPGFGQPGGGQQVFVGDDPIANTGQNVGDLAHPHSPLPGSEGPAPPPGMFPPKLNFEYGYKVGVTDMSAEEMADIERAEAAQAPR